MIRLTDEQGRLVVEALRQHGELPGTCEQIDEQLANPQHDADVVSTVQSMIGDRGLVRQIFTDHKLEALRVAIFSPRELMRLRQTAGMLACQSCGRDVVDEQVVTFVGGVLYCNLCVLPRMARCHSCAGDFIDVSVAVRTAVNKATKACAKCSPPKAQPKKVEKDPWFIPNPAPGDFIAIDEVEED